MDFFLTIVGGLSHLPWLLHATVVKTLVQNFSLMSEVTGAWLVCLWRLRVVGIVALTKFDLLLFETLHNNRQNCEKLYKARQESLFPQMEVALLA